MARSGFRLRLRTLLISLVVGGTVAGLGGRLLLEEPNLFIGILAAVTLLGPALLGVATLIWLGARERRRPLLLWGLALAVTPLLGGAAILALETVARGPGGLGMLATHRLIQTELVAQVDEPWVWDELQRRLADGHLTAEQVNDATQVLTDHMRFTRPNGWGQPLSWQDRFLAPAIGSGMVTNETLVDLCDAYYGTRPRLEPLKRLRERDTGFGIEVHYGNIWAGNSAALPQLVWTVKQVRLDGEPLKVRQTSAGRDDWSGYCDQRVPVGEHQLQVVIEAAYVPASKMVGLNPRDVAPGGLPAGLKQWESTLTQPLTIHSNDETLVKLLTSPADLRGGHGVSAKRLVVQKLREGRKKIVLVVDSQPTTGPTVSFHVAVRLDDQLIPLDGALYRVVTDGSVTTGGSQFEATVPSLVTDAKQAEVVLTPDPSGVERFPEVDATWGAPVTIRGVPVERLDLKSDGVPHSTSPSNDPSDP